MSCQDSKGRPTAYAFACGAIDRIGPHVTIGLRHGSYVANRHPEHPAGHAARGARTKRDAYRIARALASELKPEKSEN